MCIKAEPSLSTSSLMLGGFVAALPFMTQTILRNGTFSSGSWVLWVPKRDYTPLLLPSTFDALKIEHIKEYRGDEKQ